MKFMEMPASYLRLASQYGLSTADAGEVYQRKMSKNSNCRDLAVRLYNANKADSVQAAQTSLNNLWSEWSRSTVDNPLVSPQVQGQVEPLVRQHKKQTYLEQARAAMERLIGPTDYRLQRVHKPNKSDIVVAGDIHGLFADEQAFAAFCADPADTAILVGDFLDMYSSSRYRRTIDHITIAEELADGRAKAEALNNAFSTVYFIEGNHDRRGLKFIQDTAPQLLPLLVSPMDYITKDLKAFKRLTLTVPGTKPNTRWGEDYEMVFAGMVGDLLVGHFDNFYGEDAAQQLDDWLGKWSQELNLPRQPRVVMQGHSHRMNMVITHQGKALVSTGALCRPCPYQLENAGKFKPPVRGYWRLRQNAQGVTELNSLQPVYLGRSN